VLGRPVNLESSQLIGRRSITRRRARPTPCRGSDGSTSRVARKNDTPALVIDDSGAEEWNVAWAYASELPVDTRVGWVPKHLVVPHSREHRSAGTVPCHVWVNGEIWTSEQHHGLLLGWHAGTRGWMALAWWAVDGGRSRTVLTSRWVAARLVRPA
jgi:hypothetical protein